MPVIHVNVWEGFGPQKAKAVIEGITQVFVDLDIPARAVEVVVHEIPKSHWGGGGQPASEWAAGRPAAGQGVRVQEAGVKKPVAGLEQT
jgi:4-oxalocrotonate tautomerase